MRLPSAARGFESHPLRHIYSQQEFRRLGLRALFLFIDPVRETYRLQTKKLLQFT